MATMLSHFDGRFLSDQREIRLTFAVNPKGLVRSLKACDVKMDC